MSAKRHEWSWPPTGRLYCETGGRDVPFRPVCKVDDGACAFLWTIAVLVAVLGVVCFVAWLNYDGLQLGQRVIRIAPTTNVNTTQHNPVPSKFRVGERVLHNEFGNG